jgi:intein/homing endonuclease
VPGYEGKRLNLASHPDGMMIGPALTNAEFVECKADKIIAIEKGGLFTRFVEEKVHDKYKAILVHTAGQAPRATRSLIRRLNKELDLPVYIFCDADPWGMHIAMVIISGSANAAHLRDLNTPDAKWAGVWASVTGDEPVIVSKNGILLNEPISRIVDPFLTSHRDGSVTLDGGTGLEALCCAIDGKTSTERISGVVRHRYDGPIFELVAAGGYRVKATGNHSVQIFDPRAYELRPKPVSDIREGDLLASCFHVPNNESVTSVNLAKLIMEEHNALSEHVFVVGGQANDLAENILSKYQRHELRVAYPTLRRHGKVKLSSFEKEGLTPTSGRLRLRYSRHTVPVTIRATKKFARLLGYHVSEGGFSKGKRGSCCELTFSHTEVAYAKDAVECIRDVFGLDPKIERRGHSLRIRYGGSLLARVLSEVLSSGKSVRDKRIPYIVFNFPDACKVEFLRGYLRGDRVINYDENTRLGAKTVSRLLAADLVVLLRQLDCVAYTYKQGPYYIVSISNTERIQGLVRELCGRNVKVKSKLLSLPSGLVYELRNEIRHLVPHGRRAELDQAVFTNAGKGRIGYARLGKLLQLVGDHPVDRRLRTIVSLVKNKVVLLPVTAKKTLSRQSPTDVYDLEVPNSHTFVGGLGGIVLHNSDIVEYDLPSDKLTDLDVKRLYELQKDPRYDGKLWKREIETFLKVKKKAEQEAFSRYGLAYIVDEYLPAKLEEMDKY